MNICTTLAAVKLDVFRVIQHHISMNSISTCTLFYRSSSLITPSLRPFSAREEIITLVTFIDVYLDQANPQSRFLAYLDGKHERYHASHHRSTLCG